MIFLDTSYLRGLLLKKDPYHTISKNIRPFLAKETKAINITVLVEVLNQLDNNNYRKDVTKLVNCLINLDAFILLSERDYWDALKLYNYYGKSINFADCTIIDSMVKHNISRIVSFDSDFDKIKGFERVH